MIRQFDVVQHPIRSLRPERPFLINVQHPFHDHLITRVMVALVPPHAIKPVARLNPSFSVLGQEVFLMPTDFVTVPARRLRQPVANLEADRDRIVAAFDLVFTGV
jgi:toxin CcdB